MTIQLQYLDFDYSEDADGTGSFDAMASVLPAQLSALQREITEVLAWAHGQFPDACGPTEDGGMWHYDLQGTEEVSTPLALEFDPATKRMHTQPGTPTSPRTTLTLTLSGNAMFCAALQDAFALV